MPFGKPKTKAMKRSRSNRRSESRQETQDIQWLARGLAESGSRAEDVFWEKRLACAVNELLQTNNEDPLIASMDQLEADNPRAYEVLADTLESCAEQFTAENGEILLIAVPLLAWSRFSIPATTIPADVLTNLRVHLQAHVLARGVKLGLADMLFSPDQLPQGYCDTARLTVQMANPTRSETSLQIDPNELPETSRFLSDMRYILAAVQIQPGAPIFRWQETDGTRAQALEQWRKQAGPCLLPLLTGCAVELILPDAYFAACRHADRASRPYSIRASVAFLSTTLELPPDELRAVVAPFYETEIEEYRISFTQRGSNTVVHGAVWPLLGPEDDAADVPAQIDAVLKDCGLTHIDHLDSRFPLEYCDDCGAPMYPSPDGEAVHAELPEDKIAQVPRHLH